MARLLRMTELYHHLKSTFVYSLSYHRLVDANVYGDCASIVYILSDVSLGKYYCISASEGHCIMAENWISVS